MSDQEPPKEHLEYARWVVDRGDEAFHKANEAAVASGTATIRLVVLINGGAAVALLTFIGGLIQAGKIHSNSQLMGIAWPIGFFIAALAFAAVSMGCGYIVNFTNAAIIKSRKRYISPPFEEDTDDTRKLSSLSRSFVAVSVATATLSLAGFIVGMYEIYRSLSLIFEP